MCVSVWKHGPMELSMLPKRPSRTPSAPPPPATPPLHPGHTTLTAPRTRETPPLTRFIPVSIPVHPSHHSPPSHPHTAYSTIARVITGPVCSDVQTVPTAWLVKKHIASHSSNPGTRPTETRGLVLSLTLFCVLSVSHHPASAERHWDQCTRYGGADPTEQFRLKSCLL